MHWKCIDFTWAKALYSSRINCSLLFGFVLWCSRYWLIISWVTFPELHAPNPIPQKCPPQYLLFNSGNSINNFLPLLPLILLTSSDSDNDGGRDTCRCTWSFATTPLMILTSCESQICRIKSRARSPISPVRTWYRYFVAKTMCTLSSWTVWVEYLKYRAIQSVSYQNLLEAESPCP